jgi:hypothetical protein
MSEDLKRVKAVLPEKLGVSLWVWWLFSGFFC